MKRPSLISAFENDATLLRFSFHLFIYSLQPVLPVLKLFLYFLCPPLLYVRICHSSCSNSMASGGNGKFFSSVKQSYRSESCQQKLSLARDYTYSQPGLFLLVSPRLFDELNPLSPNPTLKYQNRFPYPI